MAHQYLIVFAICILFVFLEDYLKKEDKLVTYIALCVMMVLLPATKDVIDTPDAQNYEDMFYRTSSLGIYTELMIEPSFLFISDTLRNAGFSVSALFACYAIIAIVIKGFFFYKMSPTPILTMTIYFSTLYILHDLIQIRVGAAMAFGLGALYYYCNDKKILAAILVGLATFFHYSAILLGVMFLFNNKPLTTKWRILLFSIVPLGFFFCVMKLDLLSLIPSFDGGEKIEIYRELSERGQMEEVTLINPILWLKTIVFLTALWYYEFLKDKNKYLPLFIKLMGLSLFLELILLYTNAIMAFRLSELFCIVEPFIITSLITLFRPIWVGKAAIVFVSILTAFYSIFVLDYIIT